MTRIRKLASLLIILILTSFLIFLGTRTTRGSLRKGYYTLLIPKSYDINNAEFILEESGLKDTVSWSNAEIYISDYDSLKQVRIADIFNDLRADDPRLDPFIRSLHHLFSSGSYNILYIRKVLPASLLYLKLRTYFSSEGWVFTDFYLPSRILPPSFLLLSLLITILIEKRSRSYFLLSGIPLLIVSLFSSWESVLLLSLLQPVILVFSKLKTRERLQYLPVFIVSAFFTLYLVYLFLSADLFQGVTALILILINLSAAFILKRGKEEKKKQSNLIAFEHDIFNPLPMAFVNMGNYTLVAQRDHKMGHFPWRYIIAAIFLVLPVLFFSRQKLVYPTSIPSNNSGIISQSWNINPLQKLFYSHKSEVKPDISMMTAHLLYQKNFMESEPFGQIFKTGRYDVPSYKKAPDGSIKIIKEVEVIYDLPWTKQWIQDNMDTGLYVFIYGNGNIVPLTDVDYFNLLPIKILNKTTVQILITLLLVVLFLDHFSLIVIRKVLKRISIRRAA